MKYHLVKISCNDIRIPSEFHLFYGVSNIIEIRIKKGKITQKQIIWPLHILHHFLKDGEKKKITIKDNKKERKSRSSMTLHYTPTA